MSLGGRGYGPLLPHSTILLAMLIVVVLAIRWLSPPVERPLARPNILLITVDTLRADELGVAGSPFATTPQLDRLAARSKVYEMAMAPAPWTLPSMASLMTGLEPKAHGSILFQRPLPQGAQTLAEKLRHLGYHTSAAVTHVLLSSAYGFDRGFDRFDKSLIPETDEKAHLSINSEKLAALGVEMMSSTQQPFFIWLHFFDPHFHYLEHPPLTTIQEPGPEGRTLYRGEVQFTDRAIGQILGMAQALKNPPMVVVVGDHGEQFKEHGGIQHTTALYQEVVHVPLILGGPGISAQIVPGPFRAFDAHRMILELARTRQDPPSDAAGVEDEPPVLLHSEQASDLRGLIASRYKLVADLRRKRLELFDLYSDPAERLSVAAEQPAMVARLCEALSWRFEELAKAGERLRTEPDVDLSPEQKAQFESLGYLGAGSSSGSTPLPRGASLCDGLQSGPP